MSKHTLRTKPKRPQTIEEISTVRYEEGKLDEVIELIGKCPNVKVYLDEVFVMAKPHLGWMVRPTDYVYVKPNGNASVITLEESMNDWIEPDDKTDIFVETKEQEKIRRIKSYLGDKTSKSYRNLSKLHKKLRSEEKFCKRIGVDCWSLFSILETIKNICDE